MQSNDTYVKDLEETISRFLMPLRDIRFSIVIKAITGFTVIPFDKKDASDRKLLEKLGKALNDIGVSASIPTTKKGIHKVAGYPDIEVNYEKRRTYLECKTYNIKSRDSSLRAFYLQPSPDSKITSDARHLLVSFEINPTTRNGRTAFVPTRWRLYTLHDLKVQVKHEFNASNLNLYDEAYLLAEDRTEV